MNQLEELTQRIEAGENARIRDFKYLASVFEGRGGIALSSGRRPAIRLTTQDKEFTTHIADKIGGRCRWGGEKWSNYTYYTTRVTGQKAVEVLEGIFPFTSAKKAAQIKGVLNGADSRVYTVNPQFLR